MRKLFAFRILLLKAIGINAAFFFFPVQSISQVPCEGWAALCCNCANCLVIDPPPALGTCRHCHLLCPDCRKKLGDLDKAWENLRDKNRSLLDKMNSYQAAANSSNSRLTDALVKT